MMAVIFMAGMGNLKLKELTNNKPLEVWAVDEVTGKNDIEEKFAIEAMMYQKQIDELKADVDTMRTESVSRGNIERIERLQKEKVIKAISNNLKGIFADKAEFIYYTCKDYNVFWISF
jgi:hypothetical protein